MAVNMAKTLKNDNAVAKVRSSVETAKTAASTKENYLSKLNMFKF
jgi:hypothetical protein